jgi:hypothetical protein
LTLFRQSRRQVINGQLPIKNHCQLAWRGLFFMNCRLYLTNNAVRRLPSFIFCPKITERKQIMSGLDFGIVGKKAVVCASSRGLGFGCANALAAVGVNLVICARGAERLAESANQLRKKHGVEVTEVACDVTTEEGRAAILDAAGRVDILVNNAGGPPPGDFREWTRDTWIAAFDANMLTAFALIQSVIDPMIEQKFGRIVNITSGSVKSPIPALGLWRIGPPGGPA